MTKGMALGAWTAGSLAMRLFWIYGAYTLWNHLVFGEEEDELTKREQVEPHVILGRGPDGRILKFRSDFAIPDFLGWLDVDGAREVLGDMAQGRADVGDLLGVVAKAAPNRVLNSAAPFYKTGLELYMGRQFWPDASAGRPIHDRAAHAANMLSLKGIYVAVAQAFGEPITGPSLGNRLAATLTLDIRDPGEQAYLGTRTKAFDWLERQGSKTSFGTRTEMGQLLYYYRRALRYGEKDVAKRVWDMIRVEAKELTGKNENPNRRIIRSLRRSAPLGMLSNAQRGQFVQTLSTDERAALERAEDWFKEVYKR